MATETNPPELFDPLAVENIGVTVARLSQIGQDPRDARYQSTQPGQPAPIAPLIAEREFRRRRSGTPARASA